MLAKNGYLLVGTLCMVPKCADGQYFFWQTTPNALGNLIGQCSQCHPTCKKCVGSLNTHCINCVSGLNLIATSNTCVTCDALNPGYFLNEQMECEDICGDGKIVNKQCDDGNTKGGDGCSATCSVEFGFICPVPNTPCKNVIPPTFFVKSIDPTNTVIVVFSSTVYIDALTSIGPDNMFVEINGKTAPSYQFSWRIIDTKHRLVPGGKIGGFTVKVFNIMTTLTGAETLRVSFKDYSQIADINDNLLVNNSFAESNVSPFIYVSAGAKSTIAGAGNSMKMAAMSAMGL